LKQRQLRRRKTTCVAASLLFRQGLQTKNAPPVKCSPAYVPIVGREGPRSLAINPPVAACWPERRLGNGPAPAATRGWSVKVELVQQMLRRWRFSTRSPSLG